MEASILSKVILPLALFTVMLGMGLSLSKKDFLEIGKKPKGVCIGLLGQMLLLPLLALAVIYTFEFPPQISVGLFILSLCPGGVTSNMYSYLAKGNVALSISLTAVVSIITPFTIPLLAGWQMNKFMGNSSEIEMPLMRTVITLLVITVLPVAIGMFIRSKRLSFAVKAEKTVKILSMVFLFLIIGGIAAQNWSDIPRFYEIVGWACLFLNLAGMITGFAFSRFSRLSLKDSKTVGVEVGIQNGTTALFVTSTLLSDPVMAIPAAVYSIMMFVTGGVYSYVFAKYD